MVGFCRDLTSTLAGPSKLIKEVVGECGYWVVEPDVCYGNDFQGEAFSILPKVLGCISSKYPFRSNQFILVPIQL